MAEEAATIETEEVRSVPVPQEPEPEPQEPEVSPEPEQEQEGSELKEQWAELIPELADSIDQLSPGKRERILLNRLAAQSSGERPKADSPEQGPDVAAQKPRTPPVVEVPQLDLERMRETLDEQFGEDGGKALMGVVAPALQCITSLGTLVQDSLTEMHGKVETFDKDLTSVVRPSNLRKMLSKVSGATEGDIPAAMKLLEEGTAKDEAAALKVAVFDRKAELDKAEKPRPASDAARRKAEALRASKLAGGDRRGAQAARRIPATEQDIAELLRQDGELKRQ